MVADLPKCCENFSRHTKHSLWNETLLDHDQFLFHITHLSTIISINFDSHKKFSLISIVMCMIILYLHFNLSKKLEVCHGTKRKNLRLE